MNVPPEDRLVEKVAVALFDFDERRDKLVAVEVGRGPGGRVSADV